MKRILGLLLVALCVIAVSPPAFAQSVPTLSQEIPIPSITGFYTQQPTYNFYTLIGTDQWVSPVDNQPANIFPYVMVDNESRVIIALNAYDQQDGKYAFNYSGKYSRFNWTYFNGALWYCQSVFNADTPQEAYSSTSPANPDDPANKGCGGNKDHPHGFPWTKLTPYEWTQ